MSSSSSRIGQILVTTKVKKTTKERSREIERTPDQQRTTAIPRVDLRDILGNKLMREITLK